MPYCSTFFLHGSSHTFCLFKQCRSCIVVELSCYPIRQELHIQVLLDLQELLLLEEDVNALEEMYPQGEKVIYE